jgi:hypothetical protein
MNERLVNILNCGVLIVVIIVIAVMASIAVPAWMDGFEHILKAIDVAC